MDFFDSGYQGFAATMMMLLMAVIMDRDRISALSAPGLAAIRCAQASRPPAPGLLFILGSPLPLDDAYVLTYFYLYLRRYSNGQGAEDHSYQ